MYTLGINWCDKQDAVSGSHDRKPEYVLHLLSFFGGAPATALSMILFNHKSSKELYQIRFITLCIAHLLLVQFTIGV